jgi:hypothetical protein
MDVAVDDGNRRWLSFDGCCHAGEGSVHNGTQKRSSMKFAHAGQL